MDPPEIRRLLLIQLGAIGDVILCTAAIRAAREQFPRARIDFLTRPTGADALVGNPHLDEILVYPAKTHILPRPLLRRLRANGYDAVVDFNSVPRTAVAVGATRARLRVGTRGRGPRNLFYSHLLPKEPPPGSYSARRKLDMLAPLGVRVTPQTRLELHISVGDAEREWAAQTLRSFGIDATRPLVMISAVYRQSFKNWGPERWAYVADALMDEGVQILLTHGPGEREQVQAVLRHMRHEPPWDYRASSIRQLAALYQRASLWVGHDGGPKHMAVAVGASTITVARWQQGAAWTDARPGTGHLFLERPPPQGCDLVCKRCPHLGCLTAIEPDEVLQLVRQELRRIRPLAVAREEVVG